MLMGADNLNWHRWLARGAMSAVTLSLLACAGTGGNPVATACPAATWWDVRSQAQAGDVPLTAHDGEVVFVAARPSVTLPVSKVPGAAQARCGAGELRAHRQGVGG